MKHTLKISSLLILLFFASQLIGLLVTSEYIDYKATYEKGEIVFAQLPYNIERPPVEQKSSFVFIITAVLIGTIIVLLLIKFRKIFLWKVWFFLAVVLCLSIAFSAFMNNYLALILSILLGGYKIFKPNIIIHNLTEIFVYGGLAAIFVPIMNISAVFLLLILISIYDFIAVFKIKHMITLAKFQTKAKVFAGLFIPYKRKEKGKAIKARRMIKTAILGGGDMGFPLLFAGVVMKGLILKEGVMVGFFKALIISLCASIALFLLLVKGRKDKFYPAMPFLSAGCFIGYLIIWLIDFL